jgi:hypothetical protein
MVLIPFDLPAEDSYLADLTHGPRRLPGAWKGRKQFTMGRKGISSDKDKARKYAAARSLVRNDRRG